MFTSHSSGATSPEADVEALLCLINSAAQDAMGIYKNSGYGVPSIHSTQIHPFDTETTTLALKKAIRVLEGACEQLCTTLAPPSHTLLNLSMVHFGPACMHVAIQERISDILLDNPNGLSVAELANKTGIDSGKLRRILRALATKHCFREVRPDVFTNNRLSLTLVDPPTADVLLLMTGIIYNGAGALSDALKDPQFGPSYEPAKSPFMYHLKNKGIDGDFFKYLEVNPDMAKLFGSGMLGWAKLTDNVSLVQDFPWRDMPSGTTVCDVGGGIGTVAMQLANAHPNLKLTLQDQPSVIEHARNVWNSECPQAVLEKRIDFVPFDFFKERPVGGQKVYYLRHIIHDWPDAESVIILQNIRQAMSSDSRLFIHEYVLEKLYRGDATGNPSLAPKPLLPNYGAGNIRPYYQDLNMLCVLNAGERTIDEFKALGAQAGLHFVKVWDFAENGMVEFKLA
jgi:hypothetical protein